jgi:predicted transcriptional regulator YheO
MFSLASIFNKHTTQRAPNSSIATLASELERNRKQQEKANSRRILATAQAIADDDNHPNQEEVLMLI